MDIRRARLVQKTRLTPDIADFRFELAEGRFTGLEPGAHVDIHLAEDLIRQYSLWNWDHAGKWLNIAVKHEADGRGGSKAMHALREGDELHIGGPRNHFTLQDTVQHVTLIAGGIGATPIYAMAHHLLNKQTDFRVYYLVRSREYAAMDAQFRSLGLNERYHLHCDDENGVFDFSAVMQSMQAGGDVYTCGPEPMLQAVLKAGTGLRGGSIHFERFAASSEMDHAPNGVFEIEMESNGAVYTVTKEQTILEVLRDHGIHVDYGCSEGLCGSCMVDVASGEVDHRDSVLSPEEQATNEFMCVCVSRALSKRLVLRL
ncbi:PDR/VanB family oxidoreductase [Paracoccus saliphilus]|uniref:Oxidoreductase n=1 Tax=Paracoccus saliphilus TaxID=405559 RepID=A0AA46A4Q1_9RHOB|nr:PDR/VanB family oxidoreductase [Paracoccus saliphilus]WCR01993.1 oxidoreductase [Paracoccus saliphilus]SIS66199.1 vanillate O-demethylase ferredoxin subunit [Paracoccus saliphilus]